VELVKFIKARLDEDERVAIATGPETVWRPDSAWAADLLDPLPGQRRDHPGYVPMITAADLEHIARHDPARVLREVEAKRDIVEVEQDRAVEHGLPERLREMVESDVLRFLALPYADHADYCEAWRP
jgi:hypothetical protein